MPLNLLSIAIAAYVVGNFMGYMVHRLLHCTFMGKAYEDHYHHHCRIYPPNDYLSDEYREPPTGADQGKYYIAAFLVVCLPLLAWHWGYFLWAIVTSLAVLKTNAWVHDVLHIRGHYLERFRLFQWLREVHFQHHVDVHTNYGIFEFVPDLLFRTFAGKTELPKD